MSEEAKPLTAEEEAALRSIVVSWPVGWDVPRLLAALDVERAKVEALRADLGAMSLVVEQQDKDLSKFRDRATAAEAEAERMRAVLQDISEEHPYRRGYDQTDVAYEPAFTGAEAMNLARAALSAGEIAPPDKGEE